MKKVLFALVALVIVLGLALPVQADVVPTIWTDKTDYAPEETVTIYGAGFEPGGQLTVEVTRPDGWVDAWSVTADDGGAFETSYLLDGIEGLYTVVATDGTNTATTAFTDTKFVYSIAIEWVIDGTGAEHPVDEPLPDLPSPITLKGNASGTPYLGQYGDHHVQVEWGDNSLPDTGIEIDFTLVDIDTKTFEGNWTSPSHIYPGSDTYTIVVKLYHGDPPGQDAGDAPETITVKVVNTPPVANDDTATTDEDKDVDIDVLGNDKDIDGDTLSVDSVTQGGNGTVTHNGTDVTYTPDDDFNGTDSFTYTAIDGKGGADTATVTITVNPINDAPVAANDAYSVDEDNTLNVAALGVLVNDTDVDGDTLTAVPDSGVGNGTLTLNADGSFIYEPDAGFYGSDSFTYHANDGTDDSNTATVTITVNQVNDDIAPTLTVTKTVINDDGGTADASDWTFNIDDGSNPVIVAPSGETVTLKAGILYTVTEDGPDGYTASAFGGDLGSEGNITLALGENALGNITNNDIAPTLTVTKTVINDDGGTADASDWTFNIDDSINPIIVAPSGETVTLKAGILYTVTEDGPDGYTASAFSGDLAPDGTITLAPGQNASGSITNNDIAPSKPPMVYGGSGYGVSVLLLIRVTPEEATIAEGEAQRFRAVASYSGGTTRNVTAEATWVSSDNNVATVAAGLATGVAEGTTGITATLGGVRSNEATLSVTGPAVVSIEVAPESGTIGVGDTVQFTATATYSDGSTADVTAEGTWVSSDNDVATVAAGLATGVAEGSAEIRATFDGVTSDAATLSVTAAAVVSIEIALEIDTIGVGKTVQFTATATYSDGTTVDITGQATWNSSDTDVATINAEGLATGEGAGTIEITATLDGVTSDPVTLTVTAAGAALQWWAILAIVAGSLALALLLFTMIRRRRGLATGGS